MTKGVNEPYSRTWNYEVALYRGDELIDQGTVKEVAERRGVDKRTILFYLTPTGHRRAARSKTAALVAVRTDTEDEL